MLAPVLVNLVALLGLMEIALRLGPGLIPPALLLDFNHELRARIARRLNLPTGRDVRFLPRDDGGPPDGVRVFVPHALVTYDFPDQGIVRRRTMDGAGFCNPEGPEGEAGRRDLVTLGDSFTFCVGVGPDQTWTLRLSSVLGVSAVNLGMPGIGLHESLQILKRFGLPRAPRLVVLNFYEGNDLRDALRFEEYRAGRAAGPAAAAAPEAAAGPRGRWLGRHSYAYNLTVASARATRKRLTRATPSDSPAPGEADFRYRVLHRGAAFEFNPENMDAGEVRIARRLRAGEVSLDGFREVLETFSALGREHDFIPVLAYTPSAHTAYASSVDFRDPDLAGLMGWFSRTQREFLAAEARRRGIVFVDLTDTLSAAAGDPASDELLYFPSMLHLTGRGHREVAAGLAAPIRGLLAAAGDRPSRAGGPGPGR